MIPVPKSGDKHLVSNYRPISVIPVLSKVLESTVHHQVYSNLDDHSILKEEQAAGFRPNRSILDILLRTINDWKTAQKTGSICDD